MDTMDLSQDLKLSLTEDEGWMINQTLNVPLYAFGIERFKSEINDPSYIESLNKKLRGSLEQVEIDKTITLQFEDLTALKNFRKAFFVACEIADPIEFPTVTGYSWEESRHFIKNMDHCIQKILD